MNAISDDGVSEYHEQKQIEQKVCNVKKRPLVINSIILLFITVIEKNRFYTIMC